MDSNSIREFARRSRSELETSKRRHWAEQYRIHGPQSTIAASQVLWQYMRRLRPDWPTVRDRDDDLAHHVELKRKIDRAAHAFVAR